ncbi:MAG: nitroreductase family protein, partial [Erysipelotrichaceae bacterium]|nr:nitroreductase family protein [Erysipelotrichaceae bacterium]
MDALEAVMTRRSTRRFKDRPVEDDLLKEIIEAGRYAPSGGNSQTNHFMVITDKEILSKLAVMVQDAFSKMEVYEGMYKSMANSITLSKKGNYVFHYNAPCLIVMANRKDYGNNLADVACALENMMIYANAKDLGSCWINQLRWLNEDEPLLKLFYGFGMKEDERIYGA